MSDSDAVKPKGPAADQEEGEEGWLIAPPPPPPPPAGAPVPLATTSPEAAAPPAAPLPSQSTPPVNAPPPTGPPDNTLIVPVSSRPDQSRVDQPPAGSPDAATAQMPAGPAPAPTTVGPATPRAGAAPPGEPAGFGPAVGPTAAAPDAPITAGPDQATGNPVDPNPPGTPGTPGSAPPPRTSASHRLNLAAGTSAAKSALKEVQAHSPWVLGSAAILVAYAVGWFAGILLSFRHTVGFTGRERVLQFFAPGTLEWAVAILVALALFDLGRRFDQRPPRRSRVAELLPIGLFLAGAGVAISAAVGALVELTNFGNGIDSAFSQLISYLAILGIGLAETWWAFKEISKHPT